MKCPNCDKTFEAVESNAFRNADTYAKTVNALSTCCNTVISIVPVRTYSLRIAYGATEDDWGNAP